MSDTITLKEPTVTEAEVRAAVKGTKLADQKTIAEITKMVNRWATEGKRPLHTWCKIHGVKCQMTAKAYFAKRLEEYGTVMKLLTTYVGRGAKSSVAKAETPAGNKTTVSTPVATTKAPAAPTKPAKTDAPRATSNKKKVNTSSEVIEEDANGVTTRRRHTIEDASGILVQYDEFPLDRDRENMYIIGSSALRMELLA